MCYHTHLTIKPRKCMLNNLSRLFGIDTHWYKLAKRAIRISSNTSRPRIEAAVGGAMLARNRNRSLIQAARKHGRSLEFSTAIKEAKLVAGTNEHTMNVDSDPFLSDVEEDKAIIKGK